MSDATTSTTTSEQSLASRRDIIAVAAAAGVTAATVAVGPAQAQSGPQHLHIFNPPTMPKPVGYSHVAEVMGGRTVYIAGQLGLDPSGKMAGAPGDFRAQATQVFENIKSALTAVGGTFDQLVKLNAYFTDIAGHLPIFREVRDHYVSKDAPPPSTAVQVGRLARDGFLLEVEVIAVVPPRV
jgi:enamine deaminase RidA (YjgF/YER057c/UK114 family)